MDRNKLMKKPTVESFSRLAKIGTGAVIGAAVIAVFCRSGVPLKNTESTAIVSSTLTVSSAVTSPESIQVIPDPERVIPETTLININTATPEELQTLSGIGEAKAAALIAYREEHGAFSEISEIMNVSGIGEKIFESIRDRITTGSAPNSEAAQNIGSAVDLININTASPEELQALSGIGEAKAAAVIAYREEHGAFSDITEIMNVSGIGEKIFENIRGNITV